MRKENKKNQFKNLNYNKQNYLQTNLLDFIKLKNGKQILNFSNNKNIEQKNIKQLKKVAQNQQIKERVKTFLEILNNNGNFWKTIENNKYFVSLDNHMVISDLSNYKSLIRSPKLVTFLFEISSSNNFNEIVMKKAEKNSVKIKKFNYYLSNLNEVYQILSLLKLDSLIIQELENFGDPLKSKIITERML